MAKVSVQQSPLSQAINLLKRRYKRMYKNRLDELDDDVDLLMEACAQYPEEEIFNAVKAHVIDETDDGDGNQVGTWFPDPPRLRHTLKVNAEAEKQRKLRDDEGHQRELSTHHMAAAKEARIVKITDPYLRDAIGMDHVVCLPVTAYECPTCSDTGKVRFYYDPEDNASVYTGNEFLRLSDKSPAMGALLKMSECVCTECRMGDIIRGKSRYPLLSTIKRLSDKRKKKQLEMRARAKQARLELGDDDG